MNKDVWSGPLITGILIAVGIIVTYMLTRQVERDIATIIGFICGVITCYVIVFIRINGEA